MLTIKASRTSFQSQSEKSTRKEGNKSLVKTRKILVTSFVITRRNLGKPKIWKKRQEHSRIWHNRLARCLFLMNTKISGKLLSFYLRKQWSTRWIKRYSIHYQEFKEPNRKKIINIIILCLIFWKSYRSRLLISSKNNLE